MNDYGKTIKKRLIDLDMTAIDLCRKVSEATGKYFDDGYLSKICCGKNKNANMIKAINEILGL